MTLARACHTLLGLIVGLGLIGVCSAVGYSYTRFEGPVAGPEHLVTVHNGRTDYVARPEYSFAYGVEDGKTRVLQNRKETRNGDEVRGVYSVVDPDGTLRVVKYTADDANGFQAEVITNGVKTLHGHGGEAGSGSHGGANAGASVDEQVRHVGAAETEAAESDDEDHEQGNGNGNANYKVHEDYEEGDGDDGEEKEKGGGDEPEEEGGGDHQEYEGSSEEGYDEADAHSQQQQQESSEEY